MHIADATDQRQWDDFLTSQPYSPFLQSWTMGEVYRAIGQEPVRLVAQEGSDVRGICFGHVVPARRGRHLSVPYGPVLKDMHILPDLLQELRRRAKAAGCSFIRLSPFWEATEGNAAMLRDSCAKQSPLHLLAEHIWYLPLKTSGQWSVISKQSSEFRVQRTEEDIFKNFRSTTRNLIRRAEKEGVTVSASVDPVRDMPHFLALHDETRQRHGFTPYTNAFFRAQVEHFAPRGECSLYMARYQGEVIAASIHMHVGGETSYHHGASTHRFSKIPASYLLQWTAIRDALKRGDHVYNFWGIAPTDAEGKSMNAQHPFAGVTLFKTGFGGHLLPLVHCVDLPLKATYHVTRAFEFVRKWKRGF